MALAQLRFDEQSGVFTAAQLTEAGLSRAEIRSNIDGGRWRALNEIVVVTHNGPMTWRQSLWAVYLSAPHPAAICGLTAMALWGVVGFATEVVHLVVPRGARPLEVPGVRLDVHESRRFTSRDIVYGRRPPATGLTRSTVDAAAWEPHLWTAFRLFVAPVQQRLETADRLRAELLSAGRVRHRRQLLALASDLCGGADALSEVEFMRFCRRHGFPKPLCQRRMDSSGRWRYLDAELRTADGSVAYIEVDGGVHLTLAVRSEDTIKDNDANLDGRLVLRYASAAIYADDPRAVAQIARALGLVRPTGGYSHRTV